MPGNPVQGHQWNDHRRTINGILWKVRTGAPWRDLPERYGTWKSVYDRHRRWSADGTWERIAEALRIDADTGETVAPPTVGVDSSSVRAHQHAAGAARASGRTAPKGGSLSRLDSDGWEALGRSRGGLTTKIHLAADLRCRPIVTATSPGQRADSVVFPEVLRMMRFPTSGPGRPRTRPGRILADKAYSSRAIRVEPRRRHITAIIPERRDQRANRARKGPRGGRPPAFDRKAYRDRNTAERCFNKLKQHRAVATRYDKRDYVYQGTLTVASIRTWLHDLTTRSPDTA
ncbi:IS5 family transposase [Actinopolyspora alba]